MEFKDALTVLLTAIAVVGGLTQYILTSRREFLKPIREAQLRLYIDAAAAAATLATSEKDSVEWNKAKMDFLRLYYGPLAMVENYRHSGTKKG